MGRIRRDEDASNKIATVFWAIIENKEFFRDATHAPHVSSLTPKMSADIGRCPLFISA